jgi:hypothetical protein
MKHQLPSAVFVFGVVVLQACGGGPSEGLDQQSAVSTALSSQRSVPVFHARVDRRLGGMLVARADSPRTTCADGVPAYQRSCYVATFDWGALVLSPSQQRHLDVLAQAGRLLVWGVVVARYERKGGRNLGALVVRGYDVIGYVWGPHKEASYPTPSGWSIASTGY